MVPIPPLPDFSPPAGQTAELKGESIFVPKEEALRDILQQCSRFTRDDEIPDIIGYKHINPILQDGPTCGLVALAMVSSLMPRRWTVQELLDDAQAFGYSKSGEMFSVDSMATFARHAIGDYFEIEVLHGGLASKKDVIIDELINAKVVYLVPYDSDKNSAPICMKGHKAHWAILCGAVMHNDVKYVIARQGKSKHPGVWLFEDLNDSNINLKEISPDRLSLPDKYIFHDLSDSLAGKYIRLEERPFYVL